MKDQKRKFGFKNILLWLMLLLVLFVGSTFVYRQFRIDDCLDKGGRWNYADHTCDM